MKKLMAGAAVVPGMLMGGTPAHAAPLLDQIFLNMVHEANVPLSDAEALAARPEVCRIVDSVGGDIGRAVTEVAKKYPTLTQQQAVAMVGGSQVSLCPPPKK